MTGRLLLDVTSLSRWSGPPAGIARVEHALAAAARLRANTVLVCQDRAIGRFRTLDPAWQDIVLGWSGVIEPPPWTAPRHGWRAWLPSRGPIVAQLERWRLTLRWRPLAWLADQMQRAILAVRPHQTPLHDATGQRIARVPPDLALAEDAAPGPDDVVFSVGAGWVHADVPAIAAMKARQAFRYAVLCYDLIPATHPRFWFPEAVTQFETYWTDVLPLTDLVVATARCIAADIDRFAARRGIVPPTTTVQTLGFDPPPPHPAAPLPDGLASHRYVLFVSTIEPRKGHKTLLDAWRLLRGQIPEDWRLVLVGRKGWMVDDVMRTIADPAWNGTVMHLSGVSGPTLDALYQAAAFCAYPSQYEGFGLPLIEAFARGKPVLASTGGALPETAGTLAPCLSPDDPAPWATAMKRWIDDPAALAAAEHRVQAGFTHPDWPTAAAAMLDAVCNAAPSRTPSSPRPL